MKNTESSVMMNNGEKRKGISHVENQLRHLQFSSMSSDDVTNITTQKVSEEVKENEQGDGCQNSVMTLLWAAGNLRKLDVSRLSDAQRNDSL